MIDLDPSESWNIARKKASLVAGVPGAFSGCIRLLRGDMQHNSDTPSDISKGALQRIFRSPSFKASLYYCALTFRQEQVEAQPILDLPTLYSFFKASELSCILSLIYLYRKLKKRCDPEEWNIASGELHTFLELGGHLGKAIPFIGLANGLLLGGVRHLSWLAFLASDKPNFIKHRRALKRKELSFDLEEEIQTFGCTHAHLASILVQPLALGAHVGSALSRGFLPTLVSIDTLPEEVIMVKMGTLWIDTLLGSGKPPDIKNKDKFYPDSKELDKLLKTTDELKKNGSQVKWLTKGKADVSKESTPKLFVST